MLRDPRRLLDLELGQHLVGEADLQVARHTVADTAGLLLGQRLGSPNLIGLVPEIDPDHRRQRRGAVVLGGHLAPPEALGHDRGGSLDSGTCAVEGFAQRRSGPSHDPVEQLPRPGEAEVGGQDDGEREPCEAHYPRTRGMTHGTEDLSTDLTDQTAW